MSFITKLEKLKIEKKKLIEKRLLEIAKLAEKAGVLELENNLILGALLFAKQVHVSKDSKLLEDLKMRAKQIPSRKNSALKKSKKNNP
jgi:hypothetical protein